MINLQVNHSDHSSLRTVLIHKHFSDNPQPNHQQTLSSVHHNSTSPPHQQSLPLQKTTSDKQTTVISSIRATDFKLKKDLQQLINEYKSEAEKMMVNHGHDPEKEASIREHLKRLQIQKKERRQKMERDLARLESKKEALNRGGGLGSEQKEKRRKSIQERIERIKQREKRRQESQMEFVKFYEEYKSTKPKYKLMEEQFTKREEQSKEQKLKVFKEKIQEIYQPMNLKELQEFQEDYMQKKHEAEKMRLRNQLEQKKKAEANSMRLGALYKGHCHSNLMKELQQRQNRANQSYEKSKRIREYGELVREQYKPRTIRSSLNDQIESSENGSQLPQTQRGRRVVKDRYLHGQYLGKRIQYQKVPLSHTEHLNKGIQYLEYLKKIPKKPKKTEPTTILPERKRTISSVCKVERQYNPLYSGKVYNSIEFSTLDDRQSVNRMLNVMKHQSHSIQLQQKLLKNRNFNDRSDFMTAQHEYNNTLIHNIQSKLSILKKL